MQGTTDWLSEISPQKDALRVQQRDRYASESETPTMSICSSTHAVNQFVVCTRRSTSIVSSHGEHETACDVILTGPSLCSISKRDYYSLNNSAEVKGIIMAIAVV